MVFSMSVWSEEEKSELMRLLEVYPAEPCLASRIKKIQKELTSKTYKQIQSKLQKEMKKAKDLNKRFPGSQKRGKSLKKMKDHQKLLANNTTLSDHLIRRGDHITRINGYIQSMSIKNESYYMIYELSYR